MPNYYSNYFQATNNNNRIWVQGEAGAKSYLVAPNTSVVLWDTESPIIYIKSADMSGMPHTEVLDYTIRKDAPLPEKSTANSDFITKKDILSIEDRISALEGKFEGLTTNNKKGNKKDE